jgi:iron complex outermembrane receptor protein
VINVITKRGRDLNGLEAAGAYGTFDAYTGRLSYGNKLESGIELLFSGTIHGREGDDRLYYREFDDAANNFGVAKDSDENYSRKFFGSLGWEDLTLSGGYAWRRKNIPTASFESIFNDGHEETTDIRAFADLKFERSFDGGWQVMGRGFYDRYEYYGSYPFDVTSVGGPPRLVNKDVSVGDWIGVEAHVAKTVADRHTFLVGADFRENVRQFQYNFDDTSPRTRYVWSDHDSRNYGLFFQGEVSLLTNLMVNAGVRYDHFDTFGGTVNPRAAVIYQPWNPTTLKLLYGEAFRAPSDFELRYYAPGFGASLSLQPEEIRTYELVWEQELASRYHFSASVYRYEVQDLITQLTDPNDGSIYFDNEDAVGHGLEMEMEGRFADDLRARLSYALQRAEDDDDAGAGTELTSSPRHLAKFNLSWPIYEDKVFAGFELQYTSRMRTLAGSRADEFVVANLTLYSRELVRNVEFSVGIYNLFDTHYGFPGAGDHRQNVVFQDGREFRLKLAYRF